MPPLAFGLHILFQLIQVISDSFCFCPHQKLLIILSMSSHKPCRSWKQLIVYVGIAWAMALMRISFPPIERSLPFYPSSFWPTLSFRTTNTCFFDLPIKDRRPRYLMCLESCMGPKMLKISCLVSWVVLGLKSTDDLLVLIFYPDASSYLWRIVLSAWHSYKLAL